MVAVPFVSRVQSSAGGDVIWPVFDFGFGNSVDLLAGSLGLSIVGAVGGIISGMLAVRDSRATLLEYRTSMKKLALKPVVGAVAALVLYLFLSANVVSGVTITSAGIYIVAAFLAGFSERYFLRVLNAELETDRSRELNRTKTTEDVSLSPASPVSSASATPTDPSSPPPVNIGLGGIANARQSFGS